MQKRIADMILSYDKRSKSRNTVLYTNMLGLWGKSALSAPSEVGSVGYLIRECNAKLTSKSIKRTDWEKFYLDSGEQREKENSNTHEANLYFGRTLEDLLKTAEQFVKETAENGTAIEVKNALNFIYSEVIDNAYRSYVRLYRIIGSLKDKYPGYIFKISTPSDYINGDVDLLIAKDDMDIGAIKLLQRDESEDNLSPLVKQKHQIFESINGLPVYYLTLNTLYDPVGKLPLSGKS